MNTEKLISTLTDAILSEPVFTRETLERLIRTHVNIENKRASRQRAKVSEKKDFETMSEVIDLRYTLKLERDLAREETSKWKLRVQDILKNPDKYTPQSYQQISNNMKKHMGKVKQQKLRDAGQNLHRLKSSRTQDISLSKKLS